MRRRIPTGSRGIVLRATFLGTCANWKAPFSTRCRASIPASATIFSACCREEERAQPLDAYLRRILDPDPAVHGPAARAWGETERILSEHMPSRVRLDLVALNVVARPARHAVHGSALFPERLLHDGPDQLLAEAGRLEGIPGIIVQGRYDLLCPPATSHALAACGATPKSARSKAPATRCTIPASATP